MKRYTAASVLAMHFCSSLSDITETRYKAGRTTRPVYVIGDNYYCATKQGEQPAKPSRDDMIEWEWEKRRSSFADSIGWQIWIAKG